MKRRGFTLLELIVAAILILALVGAMSAFLTDALRIRNRLSTDVERSRTADAIIAMIERGLESTFVDDPDLGAGIAGDATSLRVLHAGLASWRLGTSEPSRALEDVDAVELRFDAPSRRILLRGIDRAESVLNGEIQRLRIRYFDGSEWSESFDSRERGQLPAAVEVRLWLRPQAAFDIPAERPELDLPSTADEETPPDRIRIIAIPDAGPEVDEERGGDA
jgi:prepilin-type N-terminal cleavage/methylation domain-containing protein